MDLRCTHQSIAQSNESNATSFSPVHNQVRADIEVTCYTYEGIDAVKAALIAGKAVGDERTPIQIKLIAPPRYVMDTMTLDKDLGKSVLEKAIEVVTETIVASGGKLEVRRKKGLWMLLLVSLVFRTAVHNRSCLSSDGKEYTRANTSTLLSPSGGSTVGFGRWGIPSTGSWAH